MAESPDEIFTRRFFEGRHLHVSRLEEQTEHGRKQPDYLVSDDRLGRSFYCEVKSIGGETSNEQLLWSQVNNRLTADIRRAVKQFRAVNPDHLTPNVLVWISHDVRLNVHSLVDLVKGELRVGDLQVVDFTRYIRGRVQEVLDDIDLHLWLENDGIPQYALNAAHRGHAEVLSRKLAPFV